MPLEPLSHLSLSSPLLSSAALPKAIYMVCTKSWILEKALKFARLFSRRAQSLENRDKVWSFFKSYKKCLLSDFFPRGQIPFNLAWSWDIYSQNENFHNSVTSAFHRGYRTFTVDPEKSLVPAFFKVSISDHLFVNLESGKIKYCFGKSLEKVFNFGSKNL